MEDKKIENQDLFDPIYSEYNPLSEEIANEMRNLNSAKEKIKENTGLVASLIRKMMPHAVS